MANWRKPEQALHEQFSVFAVTRIAEMIAGRDDNWPSSNDFVENVGVELKGKERGERRGKGSWLRRGVPCRGSQLTSAGTSIIFKYLFLLYTSRPPARSSPFPP